jgi:predicted HAD superfamily phosphohydrolase YqeG
MGDQLFTDVLAGKNLGMHAYTVPPIRDKRDLFTRFKRLLERPFMRAYYRRERKKSKEDIK